MDGTCPQPLEACEVLPGGVTFMLGKSIARMYLVQLHHDAVPSHLGDNGGTGYGEGVTLPLGDAFLGEGELRQGYEVDEKKIGGTCQVLYSAAHCHSGCLPDALGVDYLGGHTANTDSDGLLFNEGGEKFPPFWGEIFAIAY